MFAGPRTLPWCSPEALGRLRPLISSALREAQRICATEKRRSHPPTSHSALEQVARAHCHTARPHGALLMAGVKGEKGSGLEGPG